MEEESKKREHLKRRKKREKKIINVYNFIYIGVLWKMKKKRCIITKINIDYLVRGRGVWNTGRLIIGIQTLFNIWNWSMKSPERAA